ncbi:hypothetical protein ACFRIB_50020 [Streptomyces mirabilis]|uniref:hypothetical protein n=1 Tax=Streptomyces mirabilis TaxID=68239 RepID=UPI0036ADCBB1
MTRSGEPHLGTANLYIRHFWTFSDIALLPYSVWNRAECRRDGYRARQHSDRFDDWHRYDRRGHFSYWDDEDCSWKHDRNHRYNCDRSDRDSNRHDHDSNRSDRNRGCDSQ